MKMTNINEQHEQELFHRHTDNFLSVFCSRVCKNNSNTKFILFERQQSTSNAMISLK